MDPRHKALGERCVLTISMTPPANGHWADDIDPSGYSNRGRRFFGLIVDPVVFFVSAASQSP